MTSQIQAAIRVCTRRLREVGARSAALACLFVVPSLLSANTYYLSPNGSDANPGTQSAPFRTLARGVTVVNPGDTLILADGTYPDDTPYGGGGTLDWLLYINKSGAPGSPITVKAQNPGKAVLDCGNAYNGPQTGCNGYIYFVGPASYWVLDGLVFANAYNTAIDMNAGTPAHDITFQRCTFTGIGQHYSTLDYGYAGVYAGPGQYNLTFTGNTFTNIGRTGGTEISHDHGLYLHSSNSIITNNLFLGPITGWGVQTASGFSGLIANNTFAFNMNNHGGQLMLWDVSGGAVTVQNNIFYNPTDGFAVNLCAFQGSLVIDHNLVTNGTIGGSDTCGGGESVSPTNTIYADPMFVNASSAPYNFYYKSGSPAINAGVTIPEVPTDMAGTPRPQDNVYDIGAYEYIFGSTAPAISGVAATNVTISSATITWTTSQPASSQVEYGQTAAYGNMSGLNSAMVTQHSVNLTGLAAGTTYDFAAISANSNGNSTTSGNYSFTTASAFDFSLSASSGTVSVNAGSSGSDTISTALTSGNGQSVSFSVSGLPSGVTSSLSSTSCTPSCSTELTLSVGSSVAAGSYKVTVNASGGGASASVPVTLTVVKPTTTTFSFSLAAGTSSLSVAPGQTTTDKITATLASGTAQTVSFSMTGLPNGVSASYSSASCAPTCSSTATITAASTAAAGTYTITAQATGGGLTKTAAISLTISNSSGGVGGGGTALPNPEDWWPFNEGSGSYTWDAIAHGAYGTLVGGPAWVEGSYGTALQFNGTSSYVAVTDEPTIDLTNNLTISFWVNAADNPGIDQRIVAKNYDWDVKLNGASHVPQFDANGMYATLNYSLPMGSWHMVTFTFASGTVTGYVDGVKQGIEYNTFTSGTTIPNGVYGMTIGADSSQTNFAKGIIDDVRLYNQVLSAAQVAQLYSQTSH
ncbi:MAG TPA: LamG-like jellyroll fold domain-containing protein [Bryobacteraceae bacterium]|nr:LamG-like jellyroll fold domain-containing protein [Bryobacteraceae bacterium]